MNNSLIQKTGKPYDFIVLEFDGTRISDWYRGLSPKDEVNPTYPKGNYDKYSNEKATVDMLRTFYDNHQVI